MSVTRFPGLRRFGVMLQRSAAAVYALDAQLRLVYANSAWEQLTGRSAPGAVGKTLNELDGEPSETEGPVVRPSALEPPPEAREGRACSGPVALGDERMGTAPSQADFWPQLDRRGRLTMILAQIRPAGSASSLPVSPTQELLAQLNALRLTISNRRGIDALVGQGPAYERLMVQIEVAALGAAPVLIHGEPGTGKRTVARAIHALRSGADTPLLLVDCESLPAASIERALLGMLGLGGDAGFNAYAGTTRSIVLVHVEQCPRELQIRLLSARQHLRILATSRLDPDRALADERFHPDFYYYLTPMRVALEPLRHRLPELPILSQAILERECRRSGQPIMGFDPAALSALGEYDWPGNLGQLVRVVEQARRSASGSLILVEHIPASIRGELGGAYVAPPLPRASWNLDQLLTDIERRLIEQALQRARQNKSKAAELLGISRPRLYRRISELKIPELVSSAIPRGVGEPAEDAGT